jgi:AraC-like DNA-binding protein
VLSSDDRRRVSFWRPNTPWVTRMALVEREDRNRVTYVEALTVVVVYEGAFDGWYRGRERSHVAGSVKLKEPGEVHRDLRVHAPFTLQAAGLSEELVCAAAEAQGLRRGSCFNSHAFGPSERASKLAFAMHDALVREDASELERGTLIVETLSAMMGKSHEAQERAPLAVRRARAFLHDAIADKITLDDLAEHAAFDKFHLLRAFRAAVGLPPYEYLTQLRISRVKGLLQRGVRVAEAAQAVGFCDESQLHRHFRRIVGVTPGSYARSFVSSPTARQHRPSQLEPAAASSFHDQRHSD